MSRFRKFTDWLWLNQWVLAPIMYVAFCVWMFFTADVTIKGVRVDQVTAGTWSLIVWHIILLIAIGAGWGLHKLVDWITRRKK